MNPTVALSFFFGGVACSREDFDSDLWVLEAVPPAYIAPPGQGDPRDKPLSGAFQCLACVLKAILQGGLFLFWCRLCICKLWGYLFKSLLCAAMEQSVQKTG